MINPDPGLNGMIELTNLLTSFWQVDVRWERFFFEVTFFRHVFFFFFLRVFFPCEKRQRAKRKGRRSIGTPRHHPHITRAHRGIIARSQVRSTSCTRIHIRSHTPREYRPPPPRSPQAVLRSKKCDLFPLGCQKTKKQKNIHSCV